MPDQYAFQALQKRELAKRNRPPIFAEIDTTSSHEPWTRIPPLISWNRLGNGSIFNRLPIDRTGLTDTQQGYAKSIQYSLRTLYSFIERYGNKNTVLIVLGDHQPSRVIAAGESRRADHDHRPRPEGDPQALRLGLDERDAAEPDGAGLAHERLPEPLPQRVRPLAPSTLGRSSMCRPRRAFVSR